MREVAVSASSWKESWRGRFTSVKEERKGLAWTRICGGNEKERR